MTSWMRRTQNERNPERERGAAAVEFALVVPIFLALLFGLISYGMMLSVRQGISQATAEGARVYAVAHGDIPTTSLRASALAAVNNSISGYGVECTGSGTLVKAGSAVGSCSIPSATQSCSGGPGQCATVRIVYNYRANPLVAAFPGLGITLPERIQFSSTVRTNS